MVFQNFKKNDSEIFRLSNILISVSKSDSFEISLWKSITTISYRFKILRNKNFDIVSDQIVKI